MFKTKEEVRSPSSGDRWDPGVLRGVRVAGFMILYFLTGLLLLKGALDVRGNPDRHIALGGAEIGVGTAVLIATANIWLRWLSALMVIAALRALFSIPMGVAITNPSVHISPLQGLELIASFLIVCALSVRFVSSRPNNLDKTAAIVLVWCLLWGVLNENTQRYLLPGVLAMAAAWLWARWDHHRRTAK